MTQTHPSIPHLMAAINGLSTISSDNALDDMLNDTLNTIPAEHFAKTLAVNVDNEKLTDAEFRSFVRNTLSIVQGSGYVQSKPRTTFENVFDQAAATEKDQKP